jgi:FkbM family methyltransferase
MTLKQIVKAFIPYGFIWLLKNKQQAQEIKTHKLELAMFEDWPVNYYGQYGEDVLLRLFFDFEEGYKGFYVDIGAYHPVEFSNTKYFYDHGWCGINIDANPVSIKEFNKIRERDINIESGVSDEQSELEYYYFGETSMLNSFSKEQAKAFEKKFNTTIKEIKKIKVRSINDILEENFPPATGEGVHIDFITLDVEGFEMNVLKSFDFSKYAPDFFLVEDLGYKTFKKFKTSPLYILLKDNGYVAVGKTSITVLFKKIK